MFGRKYAFNNRQSAAQTVSRFMEKAATTIASMDNSNKPMGERLENLISREINNDEDVRIVMRRIATKFGIGAEMLIMPIVNDSNLMIEKYVLAVPNSQGVLTPAIEKKDCEELYNYLIQIALTNEQDSLKGFCKAIETAVNSKI